MSGLVSLIDDNYLMVQGTKKCIKHNKNYLNSMDGINNIELSSEEKKCLKEQALLIRNLEKATHKFR